MGFHAILMSTVSGLLAAAGWASHRVRSFYAVPKSWPCVACGLSNELDRDTCWSCGAGYGQDPLYPSRIPFERRWLCPSCAVWNGIARTACWRCDSLRTDLPGPWPPSVPRNRALPEPNPSVLTPPSRQARAHTLPKRPRNPGSGL